MKKRINLTKQYAEEIQTFIPKPYETGEFYINCEGDLIESFGIGSAISIMPSGKIYAFWTTNQTSFDMIKDGLYLELLEEIAEKHNCYCNFEDDYLRIERCIDLKITDIQFFPNTVRNQISEFEIEEIKEYSANIAINDLFLVQLSGNENEAHPLYIPQSCEQFWSSEELQDWFCENVTVEEIEKLLESTGVENNYYYLEENGNAV